MNRPEERVKHSIAMRGENNPLWIHGKANEAYGDDFDNLLRKQIRERDGFVCQECGCTEEALGRALDIHHIDYDKFNNEESNLVSLCHKCHAQTNFERDGWMKHFKGKIGVVSI